LSFEEAAAAPWGVNALQGLRDSGGLKAGQRVLINGASGGLGTWAVQIAKALGAHEVVDYTKHDFVDGGPRFDVMLDTVGNRSVSDCRSALVPTGAFVSCTGGTSMTRWLFRLAWMLLASRFTSQKLTTFMASPNQTDLLALTQLVEAAKLKPVIERRYALREVADALRHVGERHSQGQTVIQIAD
jgi:NADPH:quinone reductase-like Zn-dependent oxidoreductase